MKALLNAAISLHQTELDNLNQEYNVFRSSYLQLYSKASDLNLDAVCSHGHTVFHQPENGLTPQIGNLPKIADYIEQTWFVIFVYKMSHWVVRSTFSSNWYALLFRI